MASVNFLCTCEWRLAAEAGQTAPRCENCTHQSDVVAPAEGAIIETCSVCGCDELYVQKDFNRATGIALVALGAVFVPWTYWPLIGITILDFAIYRFLPLVTVCYSCQSVHRGYPANPAHKGFDLAVHDRHVYGAAPPGAEEH